MRAENLSLHLLAKASAMQMAGIIPTHGDAEWVIEMVETQLKMDGLHLKALTSG